MSFGSSKKKSSGTTTQNSTATQSLTDWSKNQWEGQTKGLLDATTAYTQNGQPAVAGMNPTMMKARELAAGSTGNWQGILGDAEAAAKAGVNYDPGDVSHYYNPFENDVIDAAGAYYDEQLAGQINQQNDAVAKRGAFGNVSRDLGEAELRRGGAMDKARAMAELKYAGYRDAVDTGFRDSANKYTGAGILGSLGGQVQQLSQNDIGMLEQLGATERDIENAMMKGELDKLLLELQVRQGILGSTPLMTTNTQSGTGTSTGTEKSSGFSFAPKFSFGPLSFGG
jgi:hypothetical protein